MAKQLINIQQRKKNYRINKFNWNWNGNERGIKKARSTRCPRLPRPRRDGAKRKTCYGHTCELFSSSRSRESIVFYGLFSGLRCVIIMVYSSLFFFLLRRRRFWIRSCMKVSYLMSVIFYFTFPFYRQPEIIKLTGNFWCVDKFTLRRYLVSIRVCLRNGRPQRFVSDVWRAETTLKIGLESLFLGTVVVLAKSR